MWITKRKKERSHGSFVLGKVPRNWFPYGFHTNSKAFSFWALNNNHSTPLWLINLDPFSEEAKHVQTTHRGHGRGFSRRSSPDQNMICFRDFFFSIVTSWKAELARPSLPVFGRTALPKLSQAAPVYICLLMKTTNPIRERDPKTRLDFAKWFWLEKQRANWTYGRVPSCVNVEQRWAF